MPRVKKLDLGMTALDELFMNDKERAENKLPKIFDIPLSEIDDFPDHPYRVLDDEDMQNLMESISERGIITPAMVRKKEDHSKKPEEARRRIVELIGDLPRIELFARQRVPGWDAWGNEVDSDIELTGGEPNVR